MTRCNYNDKEETLLLFYMMLNFLKKIGRGKRSARAARFYLSFWEILLRRFPKTKIAALVLQGQLFVEYNSANYDKAEDILVSFSRRCDPPTEALMGYISQIVNRGRARRLSDLLQLGLLSHGNRALLRSAALRVSGQVSEALEALNIETFPVKLRNHAAQAKRSIHHQLQDSASLALDGLTFFEADPTHVDFRFLIAIAAAAEKVEREDLFAAAVSRIISDLDRVSGDEELSRKHMLGFVTAKLTLFDLKGAQDFLEQPIFAKKRSARDLLSEVRAIQAEVAGYSHAVMRARDHIRSRSENMAQPDFKESPTIVLSAAAVRKHKIDYPGFRSDIRFVFGEIIEFFEKKNVNYNVAGRITTHGHIKMSHPYFSYHTVDDTKFGLHFKETDRPSLFSFDMAGYAGWSSFSQLAAEQLFLQYPVSIKDAESFFEFEQKQVIGGNISKYRQPTSATVGKLPDRYIFIATQTLGDAVSRNAFMTLFQMIDEVLARAAAENISVVIKRHPMCSAPEVSAYLSQVRRSASVFISSSSIHPLISGSEAVCVVNSGVGSEALLHDKPVYVFGKSDYMGACFVCSKPGDFTRIFSVGKRRLTRSELMHFWWIYRKQYAVDLKDRNTASKRIHEAVENHLKRLTSIVL